MNNLLDNPVYFALVSGNAAFALGNDAVRFFDEPVSPFAGIAHGHHEGFSVLREMLPAGRRILFASRIPVAIPHQWELKHHVPGKQFVFAGSKAFEADFNEIAVLNQTHISEMIELTKLTKPGPFNVRTLEFGGYHGIFSNQKLVSITGRRLHVFDYLELSAVCTHPSHAGKGYAGKLMKHQVNSILAENKIPFLHVRADNAGAISLYEKLGFLGNGPMHFYFMKAK